MSGQNLSNKELYPGGLELGFRWDTPDRWMLHRTTKDGLWAMLSSGKVDLKLLFKIIQVKESWLTVKPGLCCSPNYQMVKFVRDQYMLKYRQFNPGVLYRMGINKVGIFICTLYKEDSCYVERIGGAIQYILDHSDEWEAATTKEDKLNLLIDLYQWWDENDWRQRNKGIYRTIFEWLIDKYEHDPFIEKSLDFIIYLFILNKKNWTPIPEKYDPVNWYPRGYGQVDYLVHNRSS